MAQYYSFELRQKTTRGLDLNGEKGFSTCGNIALGYKTVQINPEDENSKKIFAIDEETAPLVRRIFQMYADGMSVTEITTQINAEGHRTSRGAPFNKNSLWKMLQKKRYIGIYTYKGDELFEKVAEILDNNRKAPARVKAKIEYLITRNLFCGHCRK